MSTKQYLEDIVDGQTYVSSRVTVTETHIVWFAGLSGDFNPLHMDAEAARASGFEGVIAHGMLSYSLSTGMRSSADDWAILAFLETNRAFRRPVMAGDTLQCEGKVLQVKASSSKPDRGTVRVGICLKKQDGTVVQDGEDLFLVQRRMSA